MQLPPAEIIPNHPGQESLIDRVQGVSILAARGEEREEERKYTLHPPEGSACLPTLSPPTPPTPRNLP